jgi:hypothetical protein
LDAATGSVRWHKKLAEGYDVKPPVWGWAASPLLDGDLRGLWLLPRSRLEAAAVPRPLTEAGGSWSHGSIVSSGSCPGFPGSKSIPAFYGAET